MKLVLGIAAAISLTVGLSVFALAVTSPGSPDVGQVYTNDGTNFTAGVGQGFQGSYDNVCGQGEVLKLDGTRSYEDVGVIEWTGKLSDLLASGVTYEASSGVVANIWIDTSGDGQFFSWNGDTFSSVHGDDYGALGDARTINASTAVSPLDSSSTWTGVSKLSDLTLSGDTKVAIWVGISGQAPQEGTITSVNGTPLFEPCPSPTPTPTPSTSPSCHPLTDAGNCYEPGEFCRDSDHGVTGVAGDGKTIVCENNDGWRWEPVSSTTASSTATTPGLPDTGHI